VYRLCNDESYVLTHGSGGGPSEGFGDFNVLSPPFLDVACLVTWQQGRYSLLFSRPILNLSRPTEAFDMVSYYVIPFWVQDTGQGIQLSFRGEIDSKTFECYLHATGTFRTGYIFKKGSNCRWLQSRKIGKWPKGKQNCAQMGIKICVQRSNHSIFIFEFPTLALFQPKVAIFPSLFQATPDPLETS